MMTGLFARVATFRRWNSRLLHGDLTRVILGAFYAVHTELGSGFLEAVYANALAVLLRNAGLRVEREVMFQIIFHGEIIGRYRADMVVESKVLVETKAGHAFVALQFAQLRNYLKASTLQVGLLLHFGETAQFKRIVCSRH